MKVVQMFRWRWCGHVLTKDDDDSVNRCVTLEAEGARHRDRPGKTLTGVVDKDVNH